jgi:type I restriction enzyme S subunit
MTVELVKLEDVADMLSGFAFKSVEFLDHAQDGVYLVRGDNVQQGFIRWGEKAKKWRCDAYDDFLRYQLEKDDVILAMDRPIVGGGLKLAWIKDQDLPSLLVQRVTRIRGIRGKAQTNYLRYALSTSDFLAHIDRITTGANIPHISGKDIASFYLQLPELDAQDRIVEFIATYDDLIENSQRRIALLEESARLLYREWFVNLRFPGYEAVSVNNGVPKGWSLRALSDVAPLNYGKALKAESRKDGEIPVYGSSGVVGYHNQALVDAGAIVVGRKGNVGSLYYSATPCFPIDTVFYIEPKAANYRLFLAMHGLNFISSDAAVPGLNRNYAHSLPLLIPSEEVTVNFETLITPLFDQIEQLKQQIARLSEARDLFLPKLMSGEIQL